MAEGRVLQLLGPSSGGIRAHVAFLARQLERRGWSVQIAGPAGVMRGVGPQHHDIDVPGVSSPGRFWSARRALGRLAGDYDVIHAHGLKAGWLAASAPGRPPVVVTVHNLVLDEVAGRSAPLLRAIEGRLPRRVDDTLVVSAEMARRFSPLPVTVAPAAAPPPVATRSSDEVRAAHGVPPGAPLVVCVARLHLQKGVDVLVDAVPRLAASHPDVRVLFVGRGPLEDQLRQAVDAAGVGKHVLFGGYSDNAADEMGAADVVVLPSRWEGSPLTVTEALLCEAPLVATPVGDVPHFVSDGETGWLVPVGDPRALAEAVSAALADRAEARRRAGAGRQRALAIADPEARLDIVEAAYRRVLETRG